MDSEEALQLKGLKELPPLPFVDAYGLGSFYYIRECYDEDYKSVKSMLERKKECVTVTGTPGIGKSIFYAYFFKRYRKEMKGNDTWIIAAAYEGGKLNGAIAFKEHDDVSVKLRNERAIDDFVEEADREKKNVILFVRWTSKEDPELNENGGFYESKRSLDGSGEETLQYTIHVAMDVGGTPRGR